MQPKRTGLWASRVLPMVAVVSLLVGCGPSIGQVKENALDEISEMSGLSAPMKSEAEWRISGLSEKELVNHYLEQVRTENEAILAAEAAHTLAVDSWIDTPLVVVTSTGVDVAKGESLTLVGDGSVVLTPGLAEHVEVSTWERVDQPLEDIRLCRGNNCQWHLRLLPDKADQDVALKRGFSGGPTIYLEVSGK